MKIENIIEDIKRDMIALRDKLEEQFRLDKPTLDFTISLPDIDELTTIKSIAVCIRKENITYYLRVHIHTHNGNRVFENTPQQIVGGHCLPVNDRYRFQEQFVDLLRDIIKRNKNKPTPGDKSGDFINDVMQYAQTPRFNFRQ